MRPLLTLLALGLFACGGIEVLNDAGSEKDGTTGDDGASMDGAMGDAGAAPDAGVDCGQPTHTVYGCPEPVGRDASTCPRYGGPGDTAPASARFPIGCTVTLPSCDVNFGSPQTCNCEDFPGPADAGPRWICPI